MTLRQLQDVPHTDFLLEGKLAKVQVYDAASGMPVTPLVQSRYALDKAATKTVKLPTIEWPVGDLVQLAQVTNTGINS